MGRVQAIVALRRPLLLFLFSLLPLYPASSADDTAAIESDTSALWMSDETLMIDAFYYSVDPEDLGGDTSGVGLIDTRMDESFPETNIGGSADTAYYTAEGGLGIIVRTEPLYAALASFYANGDIPISQAEITVEAPRDRPVENLRVEVDLGPYSDKWSREIGSIRRGGTRSINAKIVMSEEASSQIQDVILPITIRIIYRIGGREKTWEETRNVRMYGRNAVDWSHGSEQIGVWVTPRDPVVRDFAGRATSLLRGASFDAVGRLKLAQALYDAAGNIPVRYVPDPNDPYGNDTLDFIQYPRETLRAGFGDCDDVTVLYAAALESIGVRSAVVTTPGHIFTAFLLGFTCDDPDYDIEASLNDRDLREIGIPDEFLDLLIVQNVSGRGGLKAYWVPIETTVFGIEPFDYSVARGMGEASRAIRTGNFGFIPISSAWRAGYLPAALPGSGERIEVEAIDPSGEEDVIAALLSAVDALESGRAHEEVSTTGNRLTDLACEDMDDAILCRDNPYLCPCSEAGNCGMESCVAPPRRDHELTTVSEGCESLDDILSCRQNPFLCPCPEGGACGMLVCEPPPGVTIDRPGEAHPCEDLEDGITCRDNPYLCPCSHGGDCGMETCR